MTMHTVVRSSLTAAAIAALQCGVASAGSNSACLTPVAPHRHDQADYFAKVRKLIEPATEPFLQMRVGPSFDPDYSVSLHGGTGPDEVYWAYAKQIFVSHYQADRNIGYSLPKYNEGKDEEVSVAITTVELSRSLAERIHDVWFAMLLRTRYSDGFVLRADPTIIEFSCRGSTGARYAEAYEPVECQDSLLLTQLGHSLIDYCRAAEDKRATALKLIEKRTQAVEAYLKRRGRD